MANGFQIAEAVLGQAVDMDGYAGAQCADLASYVSAQLGCRLYGNGNQIGIANGDISQYADVINYYAGIPLRTGDIISFDTGEFGHVVIYGEGSITNALIIDQNYAGQKFVTKRRTNLLSGMTPLRVVRFKNQTNYVPLSSDGGTITTTTQAVPESFKKLYEITCASVKGIKGNGDATVLDTFYKCNKLTGSFNGDWFIYHRYDGSVGYIPATCVSNQSQDSKDPLWYPTKEVNPDDTFSDTTSDGLDQSGTQVVFSLADFISAGRVTYYGFEWSYLSSDSFTNPTNIKGTKLNARGYLVDNEGKIILNVPEAFEASIGSIVNTPFGSQGVMYLTHNEGTDIKVYIR